MITSQLSRYKESQPCFVREDVASAPRNQGRRGDEDDNP